MAEITVTPDPFHLVAYEASVLRELVADIAALVELPPDVAVRLDVDEALPHPLVANEVDVVDGVVELWCSGGSFEARDRSRQFSTEHASAQLMAMLLRARDRVCGGFEEAPPDRSLTHAQRAAWDASAWGRVAQRGINVHQQKRRYDFRLQHGFSDASDAAFERLWAAPACSWAIVTEVCAETGAVDRPKAKTDIGLLRVR